MDLLLQENRKQLSFGSDKKEVLFTYGLYEYRLDFSTVEIGEQEQ